MKVNKIRIITGVGTDRIVLYLDLPPSWEDDECLTTDFDIRKGDAVEYCQKNFPGIPVTILNVPRHQSNFSRNKE